MEKSKMALMAIPQTDYNKCFEDWIKRWHKCVVVDGEYFEGDTIDYDKQTCIFDFKNKVLKLFDQGGISIDRNCSLSRSVYGLKNDSNAR